MLKIDLACVRNNGFIPLSGKKSRKPRPSWPIKECCIRFGLMIGFPIYVGHMFEFSIPYKIKKAAKIEGKNVTCGIEQFCPSLGLSHLNAFKSIA